MAASKCKTYFALFSFHEELKASGTVLMARLVEHNQQFFGRV